MHVYTHIAHVYLQGKSKLTTKLETPYNVFECDGVRNVVLSLLCGVFIIFIAMANGPGVLDMTALDLDECEKKQA